MNFKLFFLIFMHKDREKKNVLYHTLTLIISAIIDSISYCRRKRKVQEETGR